MRRFALASVVALIAGLVAAPGPKATPVTNPLTTTLDGGRQHITNLQALYAQNVISNGAVFSGNIGIPGALQLSDTVHASGPFVTAGVADPTIEPVPANPGSLYLRWKPDGTGELWLYGPTWTCIGGCP